MKIVISILITGILVGGAIVLTRSNGTPPVDNVTVVEGKQIIEVMAKGRYSPRLTTAKADIPTIVRMKTMGTYDCTAALKILNIGYEKMLPPTGVTDIELPPQKAGSTVQGMCAMGMYNFAIQFN